MRYATILAAALLLPLSSGPQAGQPERAEIPIIMYHAVSKSPSLQGKYGISPQALESDLAYLKSSGYETVCFEEIIRFVDGGAPLPEKPVVLTFDDGNYSDYRYLYPLLQKYGMKAVLSILGKETEQYSREGRTDIHYPNLTWAQISEMSASGLVEIQSHGYDLHGANGALRLGGEAPEAYTERLVPDIMRLQALVEEHTGSAPSVFAYPKGKICPESEEILRELGFRGSLGCEEGINAVEAGRPDCLFRMKRILRPSGMSAEAVLAKHL